MSRSVEPAEVTVVVATRDRPGPLRRCLRSVRTQVYSPRPEIVVVDDASSDSGAVVAAAAAFDARVILSPSRGASAARNAGAAEAAGRVICFTDDDCEPAAGWIERIVGRLETGADVVGGLTVNGLAGDALASAAQIVSNAFIETAASEAADPPFVPASSFGCRREVIEQLPFDQRYSGVGGEERDWFRRVHDEGFVCVFDPAVRVLHLPDLTLRRFWRKHVGYGRGAYRYRRMHHAGRLEPPSFYGSLVRRGFREGVEAGVLVCLAQVAAAAGFGAEAAAERRR